MSICGEKGKFQCFSAEKKKEKKKKKEQEQEIRLSKQF